MSDEIFDRGEFVAYFRDEADELLQQIDADLLRLEEFAQHGAADPEIVNSLFRALHTIKGSAGMLDFGDVQSLAHKLENLCDLLRRERMPLSEGSVDVLFAGRDFLTDLVDSAVNGAAPPHGLSEFRARVDQFVAVYEETSAMIDGSADVAPSSDAHAQAPASAGATAPRRRAGATVRVDIERLDTLLNLVGELVINRTRVSDIALTMDRLTKDKAFEAASGLLGPLTKDLSESAALLARTSNEIQESIMKVRMVPIGQVFDRFPRLVRDVAKARGKEVQLDISGGETDLDKTIVDEVGEPLMHLLRNCVDHGIETPDRREARGKSRVGSLELNAFHEGNQIIVEVSDDGNGIDLEKVRARALQQGLLAPDDRPSDRELIDLIFSPGFSTAETVSDVSGRGVGMDVVKKNVARLKGSFDVETQPGVGTKFTIKLPLTLAIIQALLVRVAEELYAIPLDSVVESQRVEMADVRTVHGNEAITLRDRVVPLVRVADFFRLGGQRDPEKVMIVIVGLQGRQVGLVVDSFQGEQEIVIKPLSDVVGRIAGISGATILGNGSISLIIDVHSLVSEAYADGSVARAERAEV